MVLTTALAGKDEEVKLVSITLTFFFELKYNYDL
jgi:hypothetical protein